MTFRWDPVAKRGKVTIYAGHDLNGRQRQRSHTWAAPNERQARREAAGHEATLRDAVKAKAARGQTIAGLVDEWQALRDRKDSPSTVRKRAGMVARIRDDLGRVRLDDFTARHVDQWMADLTARGLGATTVANHWSCLRAILRQGDRWDLVSSRATMQARPPKRRSNRRPTPPTAAAARLLIESAPPDLRIAAMLGAYAGLRRGEVIALRWPDIAGSTLHVRHAIIDLGEGRYETKLPKSNEPRSFRIDGDLVAALAEHRATLERVIQELGATLRPDAFVLPRLVAAANGRRVVFDPAGSVPRPLGWLTLAWSRHAVKMGAPDVRFHDLRHHFATEQLDGGVPIKTVQNRLGHLQTKTTTDIYGHGTDEADAAAAEVLLARRALPVSS